VNAVTGHTNPHPERYAGERIHPGLDFIESQDSRPIDGRGIGQRDLVLAAAWIFGTVALCILAFVQADVSPRHIVGLLFVVSGVAIIADVKRDLRLAFRARNLALVFCFYLCLLSVVQNTPEVRALHVGTQLRAAALYCVFVTIWLVGYVVFKGSRKVLNIASRIVRPIPRDLLFWAILLIFSAEMIRRLAFVGWDLGYLIDQTLVARSGPVAFGRGRFGDWKVVLEPFSWLFHYIPALTAFAWDSVRTPVRRAMMVGCSIVVLMTLFFGGSRGVFAMPVITVIAYRILATPARRRKRWLIVLILSSFALAPLMDLMVRYRSVGWQNQQITFEGVAYNPVNAHRDTNFESLAKMMDAVAVYGHRSALEFYYFMIISPVPRFIWPSKPYMSQEYLGKYRAYYASMTSVGDMYMYGGLLHVVIGALVFGWALRTFDRFFAAAIRVREWLFVYLVGIWVALLSLRALWAVVVHTEWLVALLGVLFVIGGRRARRQIQVRPGMVGMAMHEAGGLALPSGMR
jgi:hypothetical protein